jgi:membrane protein
MSVKVPPRSIEKVQAARMASRVASGGEREKPTAPGGTRGALALWQGVDHAISPAPANGAAKPAAISAGRWKDIFVATWKEAGEDNVGLVAAGVAFYAFLAFVPLLTAFMLSYGLFAEPASVVRHMQTLTGLMPQNAAEIIGDQLTSMTETSRSTTGLALVLAIGIAFYGATKGAASIVTALNIVFNVQESRGFIRRTLVSLSMTAGAVVVLFLAILAVSALNFVERLLPDWGGTLRLLLNGAFFLLAAGAVVVLLAIIYRYGPNRPDAEWRWITPGSALATIVWLAATIGFGMYVADFGNYNATYGSLGAVIVFLTWLYLTFYIVLLGAELNAVLELMAVRERVEDERPQAVGSAPPQTATPVEPPAPSLARAAARYGFFLGLLGLLGGRRRRRVAR